MFGSLVLEVAVGLTFVFLLMSLVVTSITELLAGWLKLRAGTLWRGMQNLLSEEWAAQVYEHPLIRGFVPRRPAPRSRTVRAWRLLRRAVLPQAKGPSYIPSRTFALALLDSLRDPALDRLRQDLRAALDRLPAATATARDVVQAVQEVAAALPDEGAAGTVKAELGQLLGRASLLEAPGPLARRDVEAFVDLLAGRKAQEWMIRRAGEGRLGRVLAALAEEAEGDAEKLKESLEVWFNNGMDRVGGWYKRRSQAIQVLLALIVTVAANVDTLQITRRLAQDSALRQAIVARAEAFGEGAAPGAPPAPDIDALQEKIEGLGLPLGWVCSGEEVDEARAELRLVPWCDATGRAGLGGTLRFHLLGWLLSVLALSLGAPFWFDVLNKVATVRSAGKAPEERPRPPKEVPAPLEPGETPREADRARAAGRR